jgi:rhodanese-related sulfurtransferase
MRESDVATLAEALQQGARLIDVREPREYVEGHVPGAVLMPMSQLPGRLDEIDPGEPVYLICATGNRSGVIGELLASKGFDAVNVLGGTTAWIRSGRPVERGR